MLADWLTMRERLGTAEAMADETRDGERERHTHTHTHAHAHAHTHTHTHTSRKLAMDHSEQQKREEMIMLLLTKSVEEDPDRRRQRTTNDRTAALFCRLCSIIGKETEAVGTGAFDGRERRLRRFPY